MNGWRVILREKELDIHGDKRESCGACSIIVVSEEIPSHTDILRVLAHHRLNLDWSFESVSSHPIILYTIP